MRILISNMSASRVNLIQNDYAAGLPSPTAFLGLAGVIFNDLGFDRWQARVLPVLHEVSPSLGRTRPEYVKKGRRFAPVETPEDLHGHVVFSLVLDLPEIRNTDDIRVAAEGRRLAGGSIFPACRSKPVSVSVMAPDGAGLRKCPRGRAVIPGLRPDMQGVTAFGEPGSFGKVKACLLKRATDEDPAPGYRVPLAIGYRMITRPGANPIPKNARDDHTPHVFAEPGVGVGELVSVRNPAICDLYEAEFSNLFWRWSAAGNHITAHPSYNPETQGSN